MEVRLTDEALPQVSALRESCDDVLMESTFAAEITAEFGEKLLRDLKRRRNLTVESSGPQTREYQLREEHNHLVSTGKPKSELSDELDDLFDRFVQTRTELALSLGFSDYVEMVYGTPGRRDYAGGLSDPFANGVMEKICTPVMKGMII